MRVTADTCHRLVAPPRDQHVEGFSLGGLAVLEWLRRPRLCVSQRRCVCHLHCPTHGACLSWLHSPSNAALWPYKNHIYCHRFQQQRLDSVATSHNRCIFVSTLLLGDGVELTKLEGVPKVGCSPSCILRWVQLLRMLSVSATAGFSRLLVLQYCEVNVFRLPVWWLVSDRPGLLSGCLKISGASCGIVETSFSCM